MILRTFIQAALSAAVFATASLAFGAPTGYSVRSDVDQKLYRIDMNTGIATELGATGFSKIEGLAINAAGEIYGVNPRTAQLVKCSAATGACAAIGLLPNVFPGPTNAGLAFSNTGILYLAINTVVYRVDPATGGTAALNSAGPALSGLAGVAPSATCASGVYGLGGNTDHGKFYCINTTNGAATLLGSLSGVTSLDTGLDGDITTGAVWGVSNDTPGRVFAVNPDTLVVSNQNAVTLAGSPIGGFESLAVVRSVAPPTGGAGTNNNDPTAVPALSAQSMVALSLLLTLFAALQHRRASSMRLSAKAAQSLASRRK